MALEPQHQDISPSNFRVRDVTVGSDDLEAVQRKLGRAEVISRGDASTARSQICYVASDGQTYAAFETGEVQYAFYLFKKGRQWSGSDRCAISKLATSGFKTASRLYLGLSRAAVQAILGKPTASRRNGDLIYFLQIEKKTSAADLKKAREYYSNLSDEKFHQNYDHYDLSMYIVAKFSHGQMVCLGISKSETY